MIRRKGTNWEVVVFAGRDPVTGRERRVSRTVTGTDAQTRPPKDARDLEARLRVEVGQGKHRSTPKVTVAELLDRWMFHAKPGLSPTTVHGYERTIRLYLRPRIGQVRLAKLTTAMLDDLYRSLSASGGEDGSPLAPATVRQAHAVLRRALDRAVKWEWIDRNPAAHAEPPSIPRRRTIAPSAAVIVQVLGAAEEDSPDLADLVALACCGARRGEQCGLQWGDLEVIETKEGPVTVAHIRRSVIEIADKLHVKPPKTSGSERTIPLPAFVVERLRARRAHAAEVALACGTGLAADAYILSASPDGSTPLHPNRASDRFRRLVRALGLTIRLHDLRHATNTLALAAGCAPNDVADYHGHASTKMTLDVYGHAIPAGLMRVADSIDRAVRPRAAP